MKSDITYLRRQERACVEIKQILPTVRDDDSPRGVLERTSAGLDSTGCSPSCCSESFPRFEYIPSPQSEDDARNGAKLPVFKTSCLSLWRSVSAKHQNTFASRSQSKGWGRSPSYTSSRTDGYLHAAGYSNDSLDQETLPAMHGNLPWRCFTYEEIAMATHGFDKGNLVGKGGYAEVYKGILSNGEFVAVKKLTRGKTDDQRERAFLQELGIIAHIRHPNTSSLIGFCLEKGLYLILHFLPHGSLFSLLHGPAVSAVRQFKWCTRFKVAVGTAQGLAYLHTCCPRRTIHRDIKASNIMLGPEYEPQISDFGLAKWLPEQCTHLTVLPIEGTFGYLAPEYFIHGIVNEKTDIFSFGVLLLELISGRQPIEADKRHIVVWAKPFLESGNVLELVDPRLCGEYDGNEFQRAALTAMLCTQQSPNSRPRMLEVLELLLDDDLDIQSTDKWKGFFQKFNKLGNSEHMEEDYTSNDYEKDISRYRALVLDSRSL